MKMSEEMYNKLKGLFSESATICKHGVLHISAIYVKGHNDGSIKAQDIHKRLRWDLWRTIPTKKRNAMLREMYDADLHDDHIDTALKKIVKDLSNEELMNA